MGNTQAAASPASTQAQADGAAARPDLAEGLARLREARVYFSHQSVGENILDGLNRIAPGAGGLAVRRIDGASASPVQLDQAGVVDAMGGRNGDPLSKIEAFAQGLARLSPPPRLALMKFCYVDFDGEAPVEPVFERYKSTIESLRARHPDTVFVHVTTPLVVKESGWKAEVKRLTGIKDGTARANIKRHQYNELLRDGFPGEPLFDLAREEATWPDGRQESFERAGRRYPSLVPDYASDGQHLNPVGQERLARALVATLAGALGGKEVSGK